MALNGKAAVVTGAAMGIGKAITEILLQNGAKRVQLHTHSGLADQFVESAGVCYSQSAAPAHCPVYTATKHGVIGFTRAMAAASEASGYGIRVNALCPGFVQTSLLSTIPSKLGHFPHLADAARQLVEKHGVLNPTEVAEAFLELVTDEIKNGEALMLRPKVKAYVTFPSPSSSDKP